MVIIVNNHRIHISNIDGVNEEVWIGLNISTRLHC